jgi:putative transposase
VDGEAPGRPGAEHRQGRLRQEFITPYTPQQNGIVERFFRSVKEECVQQQQFRSFADARRAIRTWIEWYNERRPHQALGYLTPRQYRALQLRRCGLTEVEPYKLMAQHG